MPRARREEESNCAKSCAERTTSGQWRLRGWCRRLLQATTIGFQDEAAAGTKRSNAHSARGQRRLRRRRRGGAESIAGWCTEQTRGQRKVRGFFLRALRSRKSIADVPPFLPGSVDVGCGQERPANLAAAVAATVAAASETEVNPIPEQRPPMPRALLVHLTGQVLLVVLVVAVVVVVVLFEAARLVVVSGERLLCLALQELQKVRIGGGDGGASNKAVEDMPNPAAAAGGEEECRPVGGEGRRRSGAHLRGTQRPASSALLIRNSFVSVAALRFFSSSSSSSFLFLPGFVVVGVLRCLLFFLLRRVCGRTCRRRWLGNRSDVPQDAAATPDA